MKDPVARKLGADWNGNLWVGLHGAGKLLQVDYKTLKMTEFTPPSEDAGVYLADFDTKNRLIWTTLHHVDKFGRLDPATGAWTEFPLMYAETDVRRIEGDIVMDSIYPASIRRLEMQQIPDSVAAAQLQQFRRETFFCRN